MRLLIDLNVVLDVLFDRPGHAEAAAGIWAAAERKQIDALVPAHGVTTVYYLAARHKGAVFARRVVADLVRVFPVAPVSDAVIHRALSLPSGDFEDAVCAAAAEAAGCEAIVTRDPAGFPDSPVPVVDPQAVLAMLEDRGGPDTVAEPSPARVQVHALSRRPRKRLRR